MTDAPIGLPVSAAQIRAHREFIPHAVSGTGVGSAPSAIQFTQSTSRLAIIHHAKYS